MENVHLSVDNNSKQFSIVFSFRFVTITTVFTGIQLLTVSVSKDYTVALITNSGIIIHPFESSKLS